MGNKFSKSHLRISNTDFLIDPNESTILDISSLEDLEISPILADCGFLKRGWSNDVDKIFQAPICGHQVTLSNECTHFYGNCWSCIMDGKSMDDIYSRPNKGEKTFKHAFSRNKE